MKITKEKKSQYKLSQKQENQIARALAIVLKSDPESRKIAEDYLGETISDETLDKFIEDHPPEPDPIMTEAVENYKKGLTRK